MGEDIGSWFPKQHFAWQPPNLASSNAWLDLGRHNNFSAYMNLCTNMVTTNGTSPFCPISDAKLQSQAVDANGPHGWFYCLPRFRQAFNPVSNSIFKEKVPIGPNEKCGEAVSPNAGSGCAQKSFLVFDQTGDQTTLIYSSRVGAPVQCLSSWSAKPPIAFDLKGDNPELEKEPVYHSEPILTDEFNEDHRTDVGSEMHEDTEELNALLYSDDDSDYTDDDEVTSTDHSPSTMTPHDKQGWFDGFKEEVASFDGATEWQKLIKGVCDVPSLTDTASSAKHKRSHSSGYAADAQSSCGDGKYPDSDETDDALSCNKRMRRERIRETVSILQCMIPGGKGKDAIVILDEAIHYLKSLKLKAKALGLDSL